MAVGPSLVRITVIASFRNQVSNNVLHYATRTGVAAPNDLAMLNEISNAWINTCAVAFKECLSQEARYEGILVRYINPLDPASDLEVSNTRLAGPGTADTPGTAPSQVCGLIRKRTGRVGRGGRGRAYIPFPPLGAEDPTDLITAAYRVLLQDLAGDLASALTVTVDNVDYDFWPGITHLRSYNQFKEWTSFTVGVGFATQRRRGYFGRPNVVPVLG